MRLKIAMSRSRSSRASISNVTQSAMIAAAFIRLRRHSHQVAVRRDPVLHKHGDQLDVDHRQLLLRGRAGAVCSRAGCATSRV